MSNVYEFNNKITDVELLINKSYLKAINEGEVEYSQILDSKLKILLLPLLMAAKAIFYKHKEDLGGNTVHDSVAVYRQGVVMLGHYSTFSLNAEYLLEGKLTNENAVKIANLISKTPSFNHATYSDNEPDYIRIQQYIVDDLIKAFYKYGSRLSTGVFHVDYEKSNDFSCIIAMGKDLIKLTFAIDKGDYDLHFNEGLQIDIKEILNEYTRV